MRTKYIGFVKTSFSSPSLPFRIGGYAPGKNSQFPSLLIRRALQHFALAASEKGAKLHSEKANTRTKRNVSSRHFRGSFPALTRFSSLPKEGVHGCAKSRIKSWEEMLNFPRLFSFSLRFFREQRHSSIGFSRRCTKHLWQQRKHAHKRNCTRPTFLRKNKRRHDQSMPVLRTADRPTCVCLPNPLVSFAHKKTATHLPMDSCLKECGR